MRLTSTRNDGTVVIALAGDLRIATVADAKPEMIAAMAAGDDIQIDLSKVGRCDTAGIQFLLMACVSARAGGKRWAMTGHSESFRSVLDRVGIPIESFGSRATAPLDDNDKHNAD
jgi:anti-anti-sigma factor